MKIKKMDDAIRSNLYVNVDSIIIYQNQQILFENYYNGFTKDSLHDIRSSMKSITSLLLGIAIDKRFLKSTDEFVHSFLKVPVYPRKYDFLRIHHLLTMKSGLDCEEFFQTNNCEDEMEKSLNWLAYCLKRPIVDVPGTRWSYNSCSTMILGEIISQASNISLKDFAKTHLFDPLGIKHYKWTLDPVGQPMSAGSFFMKPEDMLKIGQIVLDGGNYKGQRILSKSYIDTATSKITEIPNYSFVEQSKNVDVSPEKCYYGYNWYNETLVTDNLSVEMIFSSGNGGQHILIVKELNLIAVCTQSNYDSKISKQFFDLLIRFVLTN